MTSQRDDAERKVTAKHKARILGLPGVTGIFTGEKTTRGKKTGQRSVVVSVAQKQPMSAIPSHERIPAALDGVPTDVIEEVFRPCDDVRYNPLKGGAGISVTPEEDSAFSSGTAGLIVSDGETGDPMILSCWHVLYGAGVGTDGDIVTNPPYAGGDPTPNRVGTTTRFALTSTVDAAVARVEGRRTSRTILDIGTPSEIAPASVDMNVRKRGATTGLTAGVVTATDWSGLIDYGPPIGVVSFENVIRFEGDPGMVLGGDSGSALVTSDEGGDPGGGGTLVTPTWTAEYGNWSLPIGGTHITFIGESDEFCAEDPGLPDGGFSGFAWAGGDGLPLDGSERFRASGTVNTILGVSDAAMTIGLMSTDGTGDFSGFTVDSGELDYYTFVDYQDSDFVDATGGFTFLLDWNPVLDTFSVTVDIGAGPMIHSWPLGAWAAAPRYFGVNASGNHCALEVDVTDIVLTVGE